MKVSSIGDALVQNSMPATQRDALNVIENSFNQSLDIYSKDFTKPFSNRALNRYQPEISSSTFEPKDTSKFERSNSKPKNPKVNQYMSMSSYRAQIAQN